MKRLGALLVAVLCLPAFAGDDWPKKGDTVFVSLDLRIHYSRLGGEETQHATACEPLRVVSRSSNGKVNAKSDAGTTWYLGASLLPRVHPDAASCAAAAKEQTGLRAVKDRWRMELYDEKGPVQAPSLDPLRQSMTTSRASCS